MPVSPTIFTDKELQSIKPPTLFIVGEDEVVYKATDTVNRIKNVAPQITTEIIPNASHDIIYTLGDLLDERIIRFLTE